MKMRVRPKKGMVVRHPTPPFRMLSEKGESVPKVQYWNRRLKDGDIEIMPETAAPKKQAAFSGTKKTGGGGEKD